MTNPDPQPQPTQTVGYLPNDVAAWLRRTLAPIPNPGARAEIAAVCETAFLRGHTDGYNRGYEDGVAGEQARRAFESKRAARRPMDMPQQQPAENVVSPAMSALDEGWKPGGSTTA